jgi:two-component system OmpR family sensor kinase
LPVLDTAAVARRGGRPFDVPGERGSARWRAVAVRIPAVALPREARSTLDGSSVVVAASRGDADATVARMRATGLVTGGAIIAALAVLGGFAIRGGLRPLRRVEAVAAAIAGGDLTHRIPDLAPPRSEIGRLAAALNGMLAQLERAFADRAASEARMRRFVADVSHELRTPLFGIKGFTELYRMGGLSDADETDRTMRRIQREATRLANLTEALLLLARLDEHSAGNGALPLELSPMDLRTLAADAQHDVRALDASRPVELTGPGGGPPGAAPVLGDEHGLRQVLANLLRNALVHTGPGTPVDVGVRGDRDRVELEVRDHGPGLPGDDPNALFERFWRSERGRERGRAGAGLGLAIVAGIVEAHQGQVQARNAPGGGASFVVRLPTA